MDQGQQSNSAGVVSPGQVTSRPLSPSLVPTVYSSDDGGPRHSAADAVPGSTHQDATTTVITRIEDILEDIVDALKDDRLLGIPLRSRRTGNETPVLFPTASKSGARRFAALLQVLYHCHEALTSGTIITKRHIYYQNPELFGSQSYVDQIVDDFAFTFGVSRDALNIVAASKGLVAGGPFQGEPGSHGIVVPPVKTSEDIDLRIIQWILVIEKEATFRSLTAAQYFDTSAAGPGLLVTAKGYPDLATRQFLCWIHSQYPYIPLLALVDFDPDGINIMRTYKHGSRSLQHEINITISGLLWLGIKSSDIFGQRSSQRSAMPSNQPKTSGSLSTPLHQEGALVRQVIPDHKTLPLSVNNRIKATNLLRSFDDRDALDLEEMTLVSELQLMLMLNIKFEIQAVDEGGNLKYWLNERLRAIHE